MCCYLMTVKSESYQNRYYDIIKTTNKWLMFDNGYIYMCLGPVKGLGADSISRCYITNMENPIVEISLSHAVTGARWTEDGAHWSRAEYTSMPTTGVEQRWLCWIQLLIKRWSCVNFQTQFHTRIAYKLTYITRESCHIFIYMIGANMKFNHTNFPIHSWHSSYLFTSIMSTIAEPCTYSLGLNSLTHNHSHVRSQWGVIEPGPTFIKPDQRNPWIKDQLWNDLLSTILHLQLPNFVSCGRDKPSHVTQNLVTVDVKL